MMSVALDRNQRLDTRRRAEGAVGRTEVARIGQQHLPNAQPYPSDDHHARTSESLLNDENLLPELGVNASVEDDC